MINAKEKCAPRTGMAAIFMRLFAVAWLWVVALPVCAESLTPMRGGTLPAIDARGSMTGIAVADGRPVAILRDGAWVLDAKSTAWSPARWQAGVAPENILGVFGNETQAYALTGTPESQLTTGVARIGVSADTLSLHALPPLPVPLKDARGAVKESALFVAGFEGTATRLLRIDLAAEKPQWTTHAGWPQAGAATSLVTQLGSVFVTISSVPGAAEILWRWSADKGWTQVGRVPGMVVPGSGRAMGQAHVLYLVRDTANAAAPVKPMTFQTITSSWAALPGVAVADPIAFAAWKDGFFWAQPEADGQRIGFGYAQVQSGKLLLKWLDWLVIVVYLVAMIGIGLYFYLREKRNSTSNFFVGGRTIPFWAAGISLYAANTSSISFIAIPAKAF
jgi:hypothetical protein